jgi:ankyrin repeat protein
MNLIEACWQGAESEVIRNLLDPECDVNQLNKYKYSALHYACSYNNPQIVRLLLEDNRTDINCIGYEGQTPLLVACQSKCDPVIIQLLLEQPEFDHLIQDMSHQTPFHVAIRYKRVDIVKILLEDGRVDPSVIDNRGNSALHTACENEIGNTEIVRLLLEDARTNPMAQNFFQQNALMIACQYKLIEIIKILLEDGRTDPSVGTNWGQTPLHVLCNGSSLIGVKILLEDPRVDPFKKNNNGSTPLSLACGNHQVKTVKYLLENIYGLEIPDRSYHNMEMNEMLQNYRMCHI